MQSDARLRTAIDDHWRASENGDIEAEHAVWDPGAILDHPQSGERFRGALDDLGAARRASGRPALHGSADHRRAGSVGEVSECVITHSESIMEFANGLVVHETQYFADRFGAPAWRTALAEPMPGRTVSETTSGGSEATSGGSEATS